MTEDELRANPRPWMTDGSVEFIENNLRLSDTVLDFGGGWSTIWWARKVSWITTVEADYVWAAKLLHEMAAHPELIAKWQLKFVACEWSNTYLAPKKYWNKNQNIMNDLIADQLESHYMKIYDDPTVIVIDGSSRARNVEEVSRYLAQSNRVRMLVVDNMEWLSRFTAGKFKGFKQYDFHEFDIEKIPVHQNGKWCTSVWVRE